MKFLMLSLLLFSLSTTSVQARFNKYGVWDNASVSPLIFDLIKDAHKSIDIEIYMMADKDLRKLLREAMTRGVRIRIVKDGSALGETCKYFDQNFTPKDDDCADQRALVNEVNATGGKFIAFNKAQLCGKDDDKKSSRCYEHGKMIIVDGKHALFSTGNFNSSNLCNVNQDPDTCNRDYSFVTKDRRIVQAASEIFEGDLNETRTNIREITAKTIINSVEESLTVSPYSLEPIVDFIKDAKPGETLMIQNQYLKEPTWNAAIIEAAKQGVHVELNVSSFCAFGKPKASERDKVVKIYEEFDRAGVKTRIFTSQMKVNNRKGYLHAKAMVIGKRAAWVGSVNGSTTSTSMNREYGIFFNRKLWVKRLAKQIEEDMNHPESETWKESLDCLKDRETAPDSDNSGGEEQ